jgi:hypothetical protein
MKKTISLILSTFLAAQCIVAYPTIAAGTDSDDLTESTENSETFSCDFYLKTVDSDDGSLIPETDMKLVEYEKFNNELRFPIENEKYAIRTLAEWNTSDANPFIIHLDDLNVDHYYAVQCDQLPEGYFSGTLHNSYFLTARSGSELKTFMEGGNQEFNKGIYQIRLNKGQPYEDWNFPKTVTSVFTFGFYDRVELDMDWKSAECIPDLEVEVVSVTKGKDGYIKGDKIGTFNTSDGEIKVTDEVTFNDIEDYTYFGIKINNIPEKYAEYYKKYWLSDDSVDDYKISMFSAINTVLGSTNDDIVLVPESVSGQLGTTTVVPTSSTTTSTTTTSISLSSSLIFDNDLELHGNDTKEFHYKYNDIDSISFSVKSDNINIENEYKDGEGTLKIMTKHCPSGMKTLVCSLRKGLGDVIKTEIPLEILFKCPNCGKLVHDEDVAKTASGHDMCMECYNADISHITTTTTNTTESSLSVIPGDTNCDDQVNMADAVFIMQCIANPDKYKLTEQGQKNADVDGSGDVTNMDSLTIQQFKLKLIDSLT